MSALRDIDLAEIIASHRVTYLVEFGTGEGEDAAYAANFPFDHIYSIEPSHRLAIAAAFRHAANQKMTFIHGKGERGWRQVAPEIPRGQPILFLLDGATLEADLGAITKARDVRRDVFLVDGGDRGALDRVLNGSHRQALPVGGLRLAFPAAT
jgi:hypothetical protein